MAEVKVVDEVRNTAAWRRLLRRLAPARIADGRIPADARALLHVLDRPMPGKEGDAALEWEYLLQAYLGMHGISIAGLTHPYVHVFAALGEWQEARDGAGDQKGALWSHLLTQLDHGSGTLDSSGPHSHGANRG